MITNTVINAPDKLKASVSYREQLCYQIDSVAMLRDLQDRPSLVEAEALCALSLTHLRYKNYIDANAQMLARTSIIFNDGACVISYPIINLSKTTIFPAASVVQTQLFFDPLLRRAVRHSIGEPDGICDKWTTFCFPEGLLMMRNLSKITVEAQSATSLQAMMNNNVHVVLNEDGSKSNHARLKMICMFQDIIELTLVYASHMRAGRHLAGIFDRPKINLREDTR